MRFSSILFCWFLLFSISLFSQPCNLEFDGLNQEGLSTLKIEDQLLFSYTDSKLVELVENREFILGFASILEIEKKTYVSFKISIASIKAKDYYGILAIGQPIKIQFLDKDPVYLSIVHSKIPLIDKKKAETVYEILALIENTNRHYLKKCELDKIGFIWSSGYEGYEIYDVDFFKKQFQCLKKHN